MKQFAARRNEAGSGRQGAADARPRKTHRPQTRRRDGEEGYVLLTLLLMIALMGVATAFAIIIPMKFEIQRDQELEMIHRGVQYSRAIRGYYKKFGRYPTKLEDLDNTNNLRYLRKHYKDPLNKNKDFRLLHFGEQGVALAGGIAGGIGGGSVPGATPVGGQLGGLNGPGQTGSAFGGGLSGSGLGSSGVNTSGVFAQSSGQAGTGAGTTPASGSDPTSASTQVAAGTAQGDTSSSSQQLVASGPIVGVASLNKNNTIREYNKKKRYNEWQFLYDPAFDRGGLITTPYQPSLQTSVIPGATGISSPGSLSSPGQSPFGQSSSGQSSSGFGNNSSSGASAPAQPPTTSPQ